jgi:hypothetical protein
MSYNRLIEKAFASHDSLPEEAPSLTSTLHPQDNDAPELSFSPEPALTDDKTLDAVWESVREQKAKVLSQMPSKVESLEVMALMTERSQTPLLIEAEPAQPVPSLRRKSRYEVVPVLW